MKRPNRSDVDYHGGTFTSGTERYIKDLEKYCDWLETDRDRLKTIVEIVAELEDNNESDTPMDRLDKK